MKNEDRVFDSRELKSIFGPSCDEVTWEWTKLHREYLNDLYCLRNFVWVKKSRTMRWMGHAALMKIYFVMNILPSRTRNTYELSAIAITRKPAVYSHLI